MRKFKDEAGQNWIALPTHEESVRHHGTWYLVFRSEATPAKKLDVPEIRWQTAATAERTLQTMSEFELQRRLHSAVARHDESIGPIAIE
jgi:hypothetical protein